MLAISGVGLSTNYLPYGARAVLSSLLHKAGEPQCAYIEYKLGSTVVGNVPTLSVYVRDFLGAVPGAILFQTRVSTGIVKKVKQFNLTGLNDFQIAIEITSHGEGGFAELTKIGYIPGMCSGRYKYLVCVTITVVGVTD